MNFFTMLTKVEEAEAAKVSNAKTEQLFRPPVVEEQDEPVKPVRKTVKREKPSEGNDSPNIQEEETTDNNESEGE